MGKNKNMKGGGANHQSPSTVFVANLPFSLTNAQLEEAFSDVGPIRRCFMVMKKGSTEHRGFGYVQFAVVEDANRAVGLKNGSTLGGRNIVVKQATHRAPLEQRRSKENEDQSEEAVQTRNDEAVETAVADKAVETAVADEAVQTAVAGKLVKTPNIQGKGEVQDKRKRKDVSIATPGEANISEKQRVAKTVIFGSLLNNDMAEEVHRLARKVGTVCSVTYPLPAGELQHHGLAQDGCRVNASSVLYTSVRSARECVAALHQKEIQGRSVWARQLGGEGSKAQKWKLIVRNLPFKVKVDEIREMFTAVGFVWDVFIPQNPETGLSKGFGFVKFTSKQDAENAIRTLNGKKISKRPIAVDWAIAKKIYASGNNSAAATGDEKEKDGGSSSESEDNDEEPSKKSELDSDYSADESDSFDKESKSEIDFEEEAEITKNILKNIISASSGNIGGGDGSRLSTENFDKSIPDEIKSSGASGTQVASAVSGTEDKPKTTKPQGEEEKTKFAKPQVEEELQRTIFISNLPFEITVEEVKQRFSAFGEVESFVAVLHPVTKRPRGTGFVKFKTTDAVSAALSAANTVGGLGILIKGRAVKILKALDKKTANDKAVEKAKKEDTDHRNVYLAKEGLITDGMPAAVGVSAADMAKRKKLHEDKMAKLQSPNFRVSKTRLIVYNVPKTKNERDLKKIFINAVISRATKQKPSIRQIKILKDDPKKGKEGEKSRPRGVAFLEFTEHEHALVALRVLNNNPEIFDPEHRPIVEFALDNVQKLKLRAEKIQAQQEQGPHVARDNFRQNNRMGRVGPFGNSNSRNRMSRDGDASAMGTSDNKIGKFENKSRQGLVPEEGNSDNKIGKFENKSRQGLVPEEGYSDNKIGKFENKSRQGLVPEEGNRKHKDLQIGAKSRVLGEKKLNAQVSEQFVPKGGRANAIDKKERRDEGGMQRKRMARDQQSAEEDDGSRNRKRRKRSDPIGRDVSDKLDLLIEQYRSKFMGGSSAKSDDKKLGSKNLKRWFQS